MNQLHLKLVIASLSMLAAAAAITSAGCAVADGEEAEREPRTFPAGTSLATRGADLSDDEAAKISIAVMTLPPPVATPGGPKLGGACISMDINDHVRQKHVGKTDQQLKDRAAQNQVNASSWSSERDARNALKNLANYWCDEILAWQDVAAIGESSMWFKANTGVSGRLCTPAGACRNVRGAEIVYTKYFGFFGFTISFLTTGYPAV
jgi:Bacterial CdiA-CT RNAse A domain